MSGITFQNSLSPATEADLQRVATLIGFAVPPAVAHHYRQFNGGIPSLTAWDLNGFAFLVVSKFLPMAQPVSDRGTIESTLELLQQRQLIKPGLVPFAVDWGGNYISFDADGAVYFSAMDAWGPERSHEENIERTTKRLAGSFDTFIAGLEVDPDA